jgi:hypothetical protein
MPWLAVRNRQIAGPGRRASRPAQAPHAEVAIKPRSNRHGRRNSTRRGGSSATPRARRGSAPQALGRPPRP